MPATDTPPLTDDVRQTEVYQEERAEVRRQEEKGELHPIDVDASEFVLGDTQRYEFLADCGVCIRCNCLHVVPNIQVRGAGNSRARGVSSIQRLKDRGPRHPPMLPAASSLVRRVALVNALSDNSLKQDLLTSSGPGSGCVVHYACLAARSGRM